MKHWVVLISMAAVAACLAGCASTPGGNPLGPDLSAPGGESSGLDLSTPWDTVVSFTTAAARGDAETALRCCLPGGLDYEDIKQSLTASSTDEFKRLMESIDLDAPISLRSKKIGGDKAVVVWRVTLKRDVRTEEGGGQVFTAGSTFDLDGTLKKSGDMWLVDGI